MANTCRDEYVHSLRFRLGDRRCVVTTTKPVAPSNHFMEHFQPWPQTESNWWSSASYLKTKTTTTELMRQQHFDCTTKVQRQELRKRHHRSSNARPRRREGPRLRELGPDLSAPTSLRHLERRRRSRRQLQERYCNGLRPVNPPAPITVSRLEMFSFSRSRF